MLKIVIILLLNQIDIVNIVMERDNFKKTTQLKEWEIIRNAIKIYNEIIKKNNIEYSRKLLFGRTDWDDVDKILSDKKNDIKEEKDEKNYIEENDNNEDKFNDSFESECKLF